MGASWKKLRLCDQTWRQERQSYVAHSHFYCQKAIPYLPYPGRTVTVSSFRQNSSFTSRVGHSLCIFIPLFISKYIYTLSTCLVRRLSQRTIVGIGHSLGNGRTSESSESYLFILVKRSRRVPWLSAYTLGR